MRKIVIIVFAICFFAQFSMAEVRRYVKVSYQTRGGYSQEYRMEVTFLTGRELNAATKTYDYNMFDNYALVWFNKSEVAILKITDTILRVGQEFDSEDFKNAFQFTSVRAAKQINSQNVVNWRIKAKEFIQWIDPRVN